jgi:hypothetical protein
MNSPTLIRIEGRPRSQTSSEKKKHTQLGFMLAWFTNGMQHLGNKTSQRRNEWLAQCIPQQTPAATIVQWHARMTTASARHKASWFLVEASLTNLVTSSCVASARLTKRRQQMPAEFIRRRISTEEVTYELCWNWKLSPSAGFSFPCDKDGNVRVEELQPAAQANLQMCRNNHNEDLDFAGVVERRRMVREPAIIRCECGEEVVLDGDPSTCDKCNADYNLSGQRLAPRSQWGEETGETF